MGLKIQSGSTSPRKAKPLPSQRLNPSEKLSLFRTGSRLQQQREGWWAFWIFVFLPLSVFAIFVLWPTLHLYYLSFQQWKGMGVMKFVGFKNYIEIFTDTSDLFGTAIFHNFLWAIGTLAFTTGGGLILALLLTRTRAWGKDIFRVILFVPQMISSVVVAIIWRWIYYPETGPLNVLLKAIGLGSLQHVWLGENQTTLIALFIAYSWIAYGFSMLVFTSAIDCVDETLFDAAKIDGANWFAEIRYILMPVIKPAARTVLIMMGIWSFQVFDIVWLTTGGGPGYSSIVLSLLVYRNTFIDSRVGIGAAMATILSLVVLILAYITMSHEDEEEMECK
jgi:raffinose/stachyose/melibiose transport system permease protein